MNNSELQQSTIELDTEMSKVSKGVQRLVDGISFCFCMRSEIEQMEEFTEETGKEVPLEDAGWDFDRLVQVYGETL